MGGLKTYKLVNWVRKVARDRVTWSASKLPWKEAVLQVSCSVVDYAKGVNFEIEATVN